MGAVLARTEVEVGVNQLLDAMPDARLAAGFTPVERGIFTRGPTNLLVRGSYYGKFSSAPGLCETCEQLFSAKTLFDVELGRRFGATRLALGARNLFDTFPDKNTLDNGYGIFPWAGASPFGYNGRFVYTRIELVLGR